MLLVAIAVPAVHGASASGASTSRSMWGFAIVNFVWWIGIGHAGTLISAILLLLKQDWRTSINRFAEAMTLFAVACAGLFPLLAPGPALALLLAAALSQHDGPLAAVAQPADLGRLRRLDLRHGVAAVLVRRADPRPGDACATGRRTAGPQYIYGFLAMGWRGSARHWHRYETAYLLLAGLATPLVVSVHTVVSFDFTIAIVPGWHSTIFPPYFVAGAIFSGLRHGGDAGHPAAGGFRPRGLHHDAPPRQHGQGHAGHRADRGLRLHDGSVHGLVQRTTPTRQFVHAQNRHVRPLCPYLLDADRCATCSSRSSSGPGGAAQRAGAVRDLRSS